MVAETASVRPKERKLGGKEVVKTRVESAQKLDEGTSESRGATNDL